MRATGSKWLILLLLLSGLASASRAEQAVGMQADMLGRGITYRILSPSGLGGEVIAHGRIDPADTTTYRTGLELRFLKLINPENKLRVYVGAGAGLWAVKAWYTDYYDYDYVQELHSFQGVSLAFVGGVDWKILDIGESSALAVSLEVQAGFYSRPGDTYGYPYYHSSPSAYPSPGIGTGIRYVW